MSDPRQARPTGRRDPRQARAAGASGVEPTGADRAAKAARIQAILDDLFPDVEPPLDHRDAFTLLVSVVLSAQTTDKKVNEVTPSLFAAAPTPAALAALPEDVILGLIRQVGLAPQKARALKGLSAMLVRDYGGRVPDTFEDLERLPGVGHKSASVVMAQAFGRPAFPVDTHVHRLAARWGLSSGRNVAQTERDLKAAFPEDRWIRVHLQMIYFGRAYCPARGHDPTRCPMCAWAAADRQADGAPASRGAAPAAGSAGAGSP